MSSGRVPLEPAAPLCSSPAENFAEHVGSACLFCPAPPLDGAPLGHGHLVLSAPFPCARGILLSEE